MSDAFEAGPEDGTDANQQFTPFKPNAAVPHSRSLFTYNDDPTQTANFRPAPLHPAVLWTFAIVPLALIGVTEYLFVSSNSGTGLYVKNADGPRYYFRNFLGQFFGMLVVVLLGMFFSALDACVKELEPFYQLSKGDGVWARQSVTVDYFRPLLYCSPFLAIYHSHWAVACSSSAAVITTNVLPSLALGMFGTRYDAEALEPVFTHFFSAFLGITSLLTFLLIWITGRRKSGLKCYPEGLNPYIDFTTGMKGHNSLHPFFRHTIQDDCIKEDKLDEMLSEYIFYTKRREESIIAPIDILHRLPRTEEVRPIRPFFKAVTDTFRKAYTKVRDSMGWENHPICFQPISLAFLGTILLVVIIIANGQPFWEFSLIDEKRFVRSAVSTTVNTVVFHQIEKNAKLMQPFYLLTRRAGAPRSILNLRDDWPFQDLYNCVKVFRKTRQKSVSNLVMPTVIIATYAANLWVVTWNVLGLNSDTTSGTFWFTMSLQICCEVWMLLSFALIFLHWRQPLLPRMPITLASKLLYMHATDIPSLKYTEYQEASSSVPRRCSTSGVITSEEEPPLAPGRNLLPDTDNEHRGKEEELEEGHPTGADTTQVLDEQLPMATRREDTQEDRMPVNLSVIEATSRLTTQPNDTISTLENGRGNSCEVVVGDVFAKSSPKPTIPTLANDSSYIEKPAEGSVNDLGFEGQKQASLDETSSATAPTTNLGSHENVSPINPPPQLFSTEPTLTAGSTIEPPLGASGEASPLPMPSIPYPSASPMPTRQPSSQSERSRPSQSSHHSPESSSRASSAPSRSNGNGQAAEEGLTTTISEKEQEDEEDIMCAFGHFIGRDGLPHVGVARWHEDFEIYRWYPPARRRRQDEEEFKV